MTRAQKSYHFSDNSFSSHSAYPVEVPRRHTNKIFQGGQSHACSMHGKNRGFQSIEMSYTMLHFPAVVLRGRATPSCKTLFTRTFVGNASCVRFLFLHALQSHSWTSRLSILTKRTKCCTANPLRSNSRPLMSTSWSSACPIVDEPSLMRQKAKRD